MAIRATSECNPSSLLNFKEVFYKIPTFLRGLIERVQQWGAHFFYQNRNATAHTREVWAKKSFPSPGAQDKTEITVQQPNNTATIPGSTSQNSKVFTAIPAISECNPPSPLNFKEVFYKIPTFLWGLIGRVQQWGAHFFYQNRNAAAHTREVWANKSFTPLGAQGETEITT